MILSFLFQVRGNPMQNLVRVSQAHNLPFKPATLYKFHHVGKFPEIFVKISGSLVVDIDQLEQLIDDCRGGVKGDRPGATRGESGNVQSRG
jgi:hypothetical protein